MAVGLTGYILDISRGAAAAEVRTELAGKAACREMKVDGRDWVLSSHESYNEALVIACSWN
jgi:hypothetical protein